MRDSYWNKTWMPFESNKGYAITLISNSDESAIYVLCLLHAGVTAASIVVSIRLQWLSLKGSFLSLGS